MEQPTAQTSTNQLRFDPLPTKAANVWVPEVKLLVWILGIAFCIPPVLFVVLVATKPVTTDWIAIVQPGGIIVVGVVIGLIAYVFLRQIIAWWRRRNEPEPYTVFAQLNGFQVGQELPINTTCQPFIYELGDRNSLFRPFSGRFYKYTFDVFRYSYFVKMKNGEREHPFTVFHFQVEKNLPHLVLDSRKNDGLISSIPRFFDDSQRIELEGDFNTYFDFFAPKEYEIEALDILSPDVMQTLLQFHTPFDIETDGRDVYIIARGDLYTRHGMRELFLAAETLMAHFHTKMDDWRFTVNPKTAPDLVSHIAESAIRLGRWRISTAAITIPAIALYIAVRLLEDTGMNWYFFVTIFALAVGVLVIIRRHKQRQS